MIGCENFDQTDFALDPPLEVGLTQNLKALKNVYFYCHEGQKCCSCHFLLLSSLGLKFSGVK